MKKKLILGLGSVVAVVAPIAAVVGCGVTADSKPAHLSKIKYTTGGTVMGGVKVDKYYKIIVYTSNKGITMSKIEVSEKEYKDHKNSRI